MGGSFLATRPRPGLGPGGSLRLAVRWRAPTHRDVEGVNRWAGTGLGGLAITRLDQAIRLPLRIYPNQHGWRCDRAGCSPYGRLMPDLAAIVARNVRAERARRSWRQVDLAKRMAGRSAWSARRRTASAGSASPTCRCSVAPSRCHWLFLCKAPTARISRLSSCEPNAVRVPDLTGITVRRSEPRRSRSF